MRRGAFYVWATCLVMVAAGVAVRFVLALFTGIGGAIDLFSGGSAGSWTFFTPGSAYRWALWAAEFCTVLIGIALPIGLLALTVYLVLTERLLRRLEDAGRSDAAGQPSRI